MSGDQMKNFEDKKKKKPEFCPLCKAHQWDTVWIEGKSPKGETVGMTVCRNHLKEASEMLRR